MWHVAPQVGTGMSLGGELLGRASLRFNWAFWALNRTPCFDSW